MKPKLKLLLAAFLVAAIFAIPTGNTANATRSDCTFVYKTYPFGISLNKQSIGTSRAEVDRAKYIQLKYLDKDLDGVVCEIEKLQIQITSTSTATTSTVKGDISALLSIDSFETQGGIPEQSESVYRKCWGGYTVLADIGVIPQCPTSNVLSHVTGSFKIDFGNPGSEHYIWFLASSKDGVVVIVNGEKIINQWTITPNSETKVLGGYFRSGVKYPIEIWGFNSDGLPKHQLWYGVDGLPWTFFPNSDCSLGCKMTSYTERAPISSYWSSNLSQTTTTTTASLPKKVTCLRLMDGTCFDVTTVTKTTIPRVVISIPPFVSKVPTFFATTSTTLPATTTATLTATTTTTTLPSTTTSICVPDSYEVSRLNNAIQPWNINYSRTRALFVYEGRTEATRMLDSYIDAMRGRYETAMASVLRCVRIYWEIVDFNSVNWPNR